MLDENIMLHGQIGGWIVWGEKTMLDRKIVLDRKIEWEEKIMLNSNVT